MTPMQVSINVDVDDLDKATHFYETAFGMKVGRRFGIHGVEVLGSSAPIYLLVKAAGSAASSTISTHKWGRLALMVDPFGHGFCFVQFLGCGYDEIRMARVL
jgi:predicted enzyme related to lactoylglutathione lyase